MSKSTRFTLVLATMGMTLVGAHLSASSVGLTGDEMSRTRGGFITHGKCSESCNRYNNLHNECSAGPNFECYTCDNSTETVYYIGQPSALCPGGHEGKEGTYKCGDKNLGMCTNDYECIPHTPDGSCGAPGKVGPQP